MMFLYCCVNFDLPLEFIDNENELLHTAMLERRVSGSIVESFMMYGVVAGAGIDQQQRIKKPRVAYNTGTQSFVRFGRASSDQGSRRFCTNSYIQGGVLISDQIVFG